MYKIRATSPPNTINQLFNGLDVVVFISIVIMIKMAIVMIRMMTMLKMTNVVMVTFMIKNDDGNDDRDDDDQLNGDGILDMKIETLHQSYASW